MAVSSPTTKKFRVILIEDDFIDQESVFRALNHTSIECAVTTRNCLQDGVEALRTGEYDVILLDLSLPDSYGMDTVKRMTEEFQTTPIIVLTGAEDEALAKKALDLGIKDYLVKGETSGGLLIGTIEFAVGISRSAPALLRE